MWTHFSTNRCLLCQFELWLSSALRALLRHNGSRYKRTRVDKNRHFPVFSCRAKFTTFAWQFRDYGLHIQQKWSFELPEKEKGEQSSYKSELFSWLREEAGLFCGCFVQTAFVLKKKPLGFVTSMHTPPKFEICARSGSKLFCWKPGD